MRSANSYGKLPYHNIRKKRNRKNILIISEFFPTKKEGDITGGVEASMFFLAAELAKSHNVSILTSLIKGSKSLDTMHKFTIHRAGLPRNHTTGLDIKRIFYILDAIWYGRSIQADIVIGTNFINHSVAYIIGKIQKIPVVFWVPDVWKGQWFSLMGLGGLFGECIEWFNLSRHDVSFVSISNTIKDKIIRQGISTKSITVIYCGIRRNSIKKINAKKNRLATLCVISRLVAYKRIDVIIKALSIVQEIIPSVQLKIIGQGPQKNYLRSLTQKLNLDKNVIFYGYISRYEDVLKHLTSSHIFLSSSATEGFGIVTIEAMTAGVPFVIADTPVNHEITGNKGGAFFEKDNPQDLAKKILTFLTQKNTYSKAQKQGISYSEKYDSKKISRQFEELILNIIKKKSV